MNWKIRNELKKEDQVELGKFQKKLTKNYDFSDVFGEILYRRGINNQNAVDELFRDNSSLTKDVLSFYKGFADIQKAARRILEAVKKKEPILIFGDYDVDGVTATSLLWRFLYKELGGNVMPFVPNRADGYGLNYDSIKEFIIKNGRDKPQLVISVDCGIRDNELVSKLKQEFPLVDTIITDHHEIPVEAGRKKIPKDAYAVVHPDHPKSKLDFTKISGCGVAWNFINAIKNELNTPPNTEGLELVGLSTVCDVMPLIDFNRKVVRLGLEEFARTEYKGIKALAEVTQIDLKAVKSYHLGYVLGPRLNAAGRIGDPMNAVRLLSTDSAQNARNLAKKLNDINLKRQDLTLASLKKAYEMLDASEIGNLIFLHNENWEEGIVGLIAGKVHEKYNKPTLVATKKQGENEWVGSARSNEKVHITDLIATQSEFLMRFGGHAQAAGFSFSEKKLEDLKRSIIDQANQSIPPEALVKVASYDMSLEINQVSEKLIHEIELLEPFGMGNPTPKFLFENMSIKSAKLIGKNQNHLKMYSSGSNVELLWFNLPEKKKNALAGVKNQDNQQKKHNFLGTLGYNEWNGQKFLQIKISEHVSK